MAATGIGVRSTEVGGTLLALISAVPPRVRPIAKATAHSDLTRFGFNASVSNGHKALIRGRMLAGFTLNVNLINFSKEKPLQAGQLACLQGFGDTIRSRTSAGSVVTRMVPSQR